jgi:hypothetical protein
MLGQKHTFFSLELARIIHSLDHFTVTQNNHICGLRMPFPVHIHIYTNETKRFYPAIFQPLRESILS